MPSKSTKGKATSALPTIPKELIDQFVNGPMSAEAVNAASMAFKKALIERALVSCPHDRRTPGVKFQNRFSLGTRHLLAQTSPGLYFFTADGPSLFSSEVAGQCSALPARAIADQQTVERLHQHSALR